MSDFPSVLGPRRNCRDEVKCRDGGVGVRIYRIFGVSWFCGSLSHFFFSFVLPGPPPFMFLSLGCVCSVGVGVEAGRAAFHRIHLIVFT